MRRGHAPPQDMRTGLVDAGTPCAGEQKQVNSVHLQREGNIAPPQGMRARLVDAGTPCAGEQKWANSVHLQREGNIAPPYALGSP